MYKQVQVVMIHRLILQVRLLVLVIDVQHLHRCIASVHQLIL